MEKPFTLQDLKIKHQAKLYEVANFLKFKMSKKSATYALVLKAAAQMLVFCVHDYELTTDMFWPNYLFSFDRIVTILTNLKIHVHPETEEKCRFLDHFLVTDYSTDEDYRPKKTILSLFGYKSFAAIIDNPLPEELTKNSFFGCVDKHHFPRSGKISGL